MRVFQIAVLQRCELGSLEKGLNAQIIMGTKDVCRDRGCKIAPKLLMVSTGAYINGKLYIVKQRDVSLVLNVY